MKNEEIFFKNRTAFGPFSDPYEALPLCKGFPLTVLSEERQSCYSVVLPVGQTEQKSAILMNAANHVICLPSTKIMRIQLKVMG